MNLSAAQIKHLRSLKLKKFRQKYRQFLIEGDKLVRETLLEQPQQLLKIYALPEWIAHLPERVKQKSNDLLHPISAKTLQQISSLHSPNKAIALIKMPQQATSPVKEGWSFYLDQLRDPGNAGTIWRIADWFGFRQILNSPNSVDFYNPKVIQASMGAFLRVPVITVPPQQIPMLQNKSQLRLWGADMKGLPFDKWKPPAHGILVIGSEAHGITPPLRQQLHATICIPKAANSRAESLNAAIAAGILAAKIANTT